MELICALLTIYLVIVFARVILSWFPLSPDGAIAGIYTFTYTVTEPLLGPLRNVLPPIGGFDLSPIVVFVGIEVLRTALGC